MRSNIFAAAALGAVLVASSAAAAAPRYRLTKLASPPGATSAVARALSANGQIAGEGVASPDATGQTPISFGNAISPLTSYTATIAGAATSFVRGVNDKGVAAGTAQSAFNGGYYPILSSRVGMTELTPLSNFNNGGANGINSSGTVVGYSLISGNFASEGSARPIAGSGDLQRATVWNAGVATALANPFGNYTSIATAINAAGQVAGVVNSGLSQATSRATIWNAGVATVLAIGANQRSTARAISSNGWVAGRRDSLMTGAYAGSIWAPDGTTFTLAAVGAGCTNSDLRGINANGTAVGFSQLPGSCGANGTAGTLWQRNGTSFTGYAVNSLVANLDGWDLYAPQAINDRGQIVGFGTDEIGRNRAFLLTAVPEPASWAMLIIGFGLTGSAMRRHRGSRRVQPA